MARVDFYVLAQSGEPARQSFACRLAEKAWRLDNTVHILAIGQQQAEHLDELLWTFRDGSFVPHEIGSTDANVPVSIGWNPDGNAGRDVLINLSDTVPACAAAFPRIAELVGADDESRARGRQRFATYRDAGHEIETHKL